MCFLGLPRLTSRPGNGGGTFLWSWRSSLGSLDWRTAQGTALMEIEGRLWGARTVSGGSRRRWDIFSLGRHLTIADQGPCNIQRLISSLDVIEEGGASIGIVKWRARRSAPVERTAMPGTARHGSSFTWFLGCFLLGGKDGGCWDSSAPRLNFRAILVDSCVNLLLLSARNRQWLFPRR